MLGISLFTKVFSKNRGSFLILTGAYLLFLIVPIISDEFLISVLILFFIWCIVAQSWNFLLGFSNLWAFGNLVFFAIGGYTSGYLSTVYKIPQLLGLIIGLAVGALAGLLIGLPTLRLKKIYLALFTFASQEFLRHLIVQTELTPITGGPIGLQFIPQLSLPGFPFVILNYYVGLILFTASMLCLLYVRKAKIGWALGSISSSEEVAESIGVNTYKYKLLAFVLASSFTGLSGAFYAYYFGSITPKTLSFELLVMILFMIVIGGPHSFYGPIAGAALLTFTSEYAKGVFLGVTAHIRIIVMGALIILILRTYPTGLIGFIETVTHRLESSTILKTRRRTMVPR